jgi:hypothetical protein
MIKIIILELIINQNKLLKSNLLTKKAFHFQTPTSSNLKRMRQSSLVKDLKIYFMGLNQLKKMIRQIYSCKQAKTK